MGIFCHELKKILLHQKGFLIILASMATAMIFWCVNDSPAKPDMELYQAEYKKELAEVEGPLTKEKSAWIENAFSDAFSAKQQLPKLYQKYYAGSISTEEFERRRIALQQSADRYQGLNVLYDQYMYVRESESNRWLLYTNGWDALLSNDMPNLFFIISLALLLIPFWCREYSCGMDQLILTTANGSKTLGQLKSILSLSLAAGLSLVFDSLYLFFCMLKYDLPCPNAPIQSLQTFENCIYDISLGKALIIVLCVRMVGAVFLSASILVTVTLTRKYASTCLMICCILFLPWLALPDTLQYRLPLPLAWLRASGIFRGDKISVSSTGEDMLIFSHLSEGDLLFQSMAACLLITLSLFIVWKRGRNVLLRLDRPRIVSISVSLLLLACTLSSCSYTSENSTNVVPFNSSQASVFYGDTYIVDASDTNIVVEFSDNHQESLIRTPFRESQNSLSAVYGTPESITYFISYMESEDLVRLSERENHTIYRLLCVDLATFDETVLFEVESTKDNKWAFLSQVRAFFLDAENIYFILPQEIRQVNRRSHAVTALDISTSQNIAFDGSRIYYLNEACCLTSYDPVTGNSKVWKEIAASEFILGEKGIYYTDLNKNGQLCFYSLSTSETTVLYEGAAATLHIEKGMLIFTAANQTQTIKIS